MIWCSVYSRADGRDMPFHEGVLLSDRAAMDNYFVSSSLAHLPRAWDQHRPLHCRLLTKLSPPSILSAIIPSTAIRPSSSASSSRSSRSLLWKDRLLSSSIALPTIWHKQCLPGRVAVLAEFPVNATFRLKPALAEIPIRTALSGITCRLSAKDQGTV